MVDFPDSASEDTLSSGPRLMMGADEDLFTALRRMILEQIETMMAGFVPHEDDGVLDHSIHEARKAGKRVRALLRLCRNEVTPEEYRWANTLVRDQGRLLADARIASVLIDTLDSVIVETGFESEDLGELRQAADRRHEAALRRIRNDAEGRSAARSALADLVDWVDGLSPPIAYAEQGIAALGPVVRESYRRARAEMREAAKLNTAEAFHDWRKQLKYLRYHVEAVSGACDSRIEALAGALDDLSETLGAEHDLVDLMDFGAGAPEPAPAELFDLLVSRSAELRDQSLSVGSELLADKPKRFERYLVEHCRDVGGSAP